jgi:hypothetical protein
MKDNVVYPTGRQVLASPSKAITKATEILQSLRGDTATKDMALQPMAVEEDLSATRSADHDWFKQNPHRQHHLRPSTPEEVAANQRMGLAVPPGSIELTVLRREPDGTILALSFPIAHLLAAPSDSESIARELFINIALGRPSDFMDLPSVRARSSSSGGQA